MNKLKLVLLILFIAGVSSYGHSKDLFYNLNGFKGKIAVLYSMQGENVKPVDTAYRQSTGAFVFFDIENLDVGIYSVYFSDSLYTEVIINNEDIVISADVKDLLYTLKVHKSLENKILFDYWHYAIMVRDSTSIYEYRKHKIEQKTYNSNHPEIKKLDKRIAALNYALENYVNNQQNKHPNSFAPVLLKSYLIPDMDKYNLAHPKAKYTDKKSFYRDHFFDNVNFNDERFLNTKVIYTTISDYMKTFSNPASTVNYNRIVDKILTTAVVNNKVYEYCLDLFIRTFEISVFENVLLHIIDDYYLPYYSLSGFNTTYYSHLSERIKALKPGKLAPNIVLNDPSGVEHNLYETPAKAKMIIFYSSDCSHCAEALPGLIDIYNMYKDQGLITFGVAIDDDEKMWKDEIKKFNMNWTSVSDLKGMASPLIDLFNINSTPYIIILAEDNVIMKKPSELNDIHATLVQLLNKK